MSKKQLIGLAMSLAFPAVTMAAGGHGGHSMKGHDMAPTEQNGHSAAIGKPGNGSRIDRTVEVIMTDEMRFTPARIEVKGGETVRFFVRNAGKLPHEMVLGSLGDLKAHAEMMRKMPDMEHDEPNMVKLKPGQRGGIVWQFTDAGTVDFACTIPGHMEAGMVGAVSVTR